jgi:hypothetical protein
MPNRPHKPIAGVSYLPGQTELPGAERDLRVRAKQLAGQGLKPQKAQLPPDHGLFSDEASQADLLDLLNKTSTNPKES